MSVTSSRKNLALHKSTPHYNYTSETILTTGFNMLQKGNQTDMHLPGAPTENENKDAFFCSSTSGKGGVQGGGGGVREGGRVKEK